MKGRQHIVRLDDIKIWSGERRYEQLKRKTEKRTSWRTMNLRIKNGTNDWLVIIELLIIAALKSKI